jgi:signal transduction histidine kinase
VGAQTDTIAQSREIARLRSGLMDRRIRSYSAPDTAYADTLNELAYAFYGVNADSAFFYGRKALDYASANDYRRGMSESWRMLGNTYEMVSDYVNMLSSYHRSLDIAGQIGNDRLVAKVTANLALFYDQEAEYAQAHQLMEKVSAIYKRTGDSLESAFVSSHLSDIAFRQRQYDVALEYAGRALQAARAMKNDADVATYNNSIGKILAARGDYHGALSHYLLALTWYREMKEQLGTMATNNLLADVYLSLKDYPLALQYAELSLHVAQSMHRKTEIRGSAGVLAAIYEAKGEDRNALKYYKLYKDYSDSLSNDQTRKQLLAMSAGYDFEKKAMKLQEEAAQKDARYQRVLRKDALQISITVIVIAVLSLLAFILLRSRVVNKRVNQLLREKNEKIEEQKEALEHQAVQLLLNNQQKDKLFSIIAHDLRGPLNSLKGLMDFLKEKRLSEQEINTMMTELRRNIDYSSELVGNLLFWASSQLDGIVVTPVVLPLQPLVHDILTLFSHQAGEKEILLLENVPDSLEGYADKDMIQVVLRNLVSNSIKFCRPGDSVTVSARQQDTEIEFCVKDTGIGMKEEVLTRILRKESFTSYGTAKEKGTGLGMLLCREFAEANEGRFRIESEWGKGCRCYFTIPAVPSSSSISV